MSERKRPPKRIRVERPSNLPGEDWRPVVGWEDYYEVSSLGRVWSILRVTTRRNGTVQRSGGELRAISTSPTKWGGWYASVTLYRVDDDKRVQITRRVHVLVARAFLGEPNDDQEVRHLDGDGLNNNLENLKWGTKSENRDDTRRHGRQRKEWKTHCIHGHEYTPENTRRNVRGVRVCLTCLQAHWKKENDKRSAKRRADKEEGGEAA